MNNRCSTPVEYPGDTCDEHPDCDRCGGRGTIIRNHVGFPCPRCDETYQHFRCDGCGRVVDEPPNTCECGGSFIRYVRADDA